MSRHGSYLEKSAAKAEELAQAAREAERELLANPAVMALFAGYDPQSVAEFLRFYAERKVKWLIDGPQRLAYLERERLKYETHAYERLWDIQQKKLFDLQCQWRAGLIRLPGVEVTDQFFFWGRRPDHCPPEVLPPVTDAELALYLDYLNSPACRDVGYSRRYRPDDWQDFAGMRPPRPGEEEYHYPRPYPDWYQYYDEHHGTGHLRFLPDVRGERQAFYEKLAHDEKLRLNPPPPFEEETRPWPDFKERHAQFDEFTRRFDPTPHLIELHRLYEHVHYRHPDHDEAFMAGVVLAEEADSPPLTEAYPDWRAAVIDLANGIRKERLTAAMPAAFARYQLCLETGVRFPQPHEHSPDPEESLIPLKLQRERVLRGRELNGEPRDFEF